MALHSWNILRRSLVISPVHMEIERFPLHLFLNLSTIFTGHTPRSPLRSVVTGEKYDEQNQHYPSAQEETPIKRNNEISIRECSMRGEPLIRTSIKCELAMFI